MKISNILEAQFSKQIYAYHATPSENLRSILKNGLVPNFKSGGYGSGEVSSAGYSLTPLPGIYFTRDHKDAVSISKTLENVGPGIVLICKVQPQQAEMDEDRLMSEDIVDEPLFRRNIRAELQSDEMFGEDISGMRDFVRSYADDVMSNIVSLVPAQRISPMKQKHMRPFVEAYLMALLEFIIAKEIGDIANEAPVKAAQTELTKQLRQLNKDAPEVLDTFKINSKIGFSGSNKIVGIFFPKGRIGWGDLGALEGHEYHKYDNPATLLRKIA